MEKSEVRRMMKIGRRELCQENRQRWERCITTHIMHRISAGGALSVLGYLACDGEVDLAELLDRCEAGGLEVFLPRVRDKKAKTMDAVRMPVPWRDYVVTGSYGIMEPHPDLPPAGPDEFQIALVPGVAFDRSGARIGFGGGYYDRFLPLTRLDAVRIGVAFDFQIVGSLTCEDYDVRMHELCSESGCKPTSPECARTSKDEQGRVRSR